MVVVDVNVDGKPDVYVANDTVANFLYLNKSEKGTIRFERAGMLAGVALDDGGSPNGSMGVDAGDPEGTGKPALWVTNYENEFHALYRNVSTGGPRAFRVRDTQSSGIGAIGQKFVGWGTGFVDFDLDGWEDLFIANGHAIRFPTGTTRQPASRCCCSTGAAASSSTSPGAAASTSRNSTSAAARCSATWTTTAASTWSLCNTNDPVALLRNVAADENHWLGVELAGADHADVVGARVMLEVGGRTQTRFAKGGGSYASSPDRRLRVRPGQGGSKVAKLTVVWPDGTRQEWADILVDRYHVATQGQERLGTSLKR